MPYSPAKADLQACLRELKGVQLELRRRRSDFAADDEARTLAQCERHVAAAREHLKYLQQTQRMTPNAYRVRAYLGQGPPQPRLPKVLWRSGGGSDPETESLSSVGSRSVFTSVRPPRAPELRHLPEVSHIDPSSHGWGRLSDTSSVVSSRHEDLTRHGDFESDASSVLSMDDLTHLREA